MSIVELIAERPHQPVAALYGDVASVVPSWDSAIFQIFDNSIEYMTRSDGEKQTIRLKFKADTGERTLGHFGVRHLLSAGTLRGSVIVDQTIRVLATGGYLFIDEIENHLNKQLVGVVIDFFNSKELNPHGATLIFTTHYPEVLDFISRKDNIYFMVRDDEYQTEMIKCSNRIKRIENKKSEVFFSNIIKGTAPKYTEIAKLRDYAAAQLRGAGDDR
jgi:hypothetical protein